MVAGERDAAVREAEDCYTQYLELEQVNSTHKDELRHTQGLLEVPLIPTHMCLSHLLPPSFSSSSTLPLCLHACVYVCRKATGQE